MWREMNSTCLALGILLLSMYQEMLGKIKKNRGLEENDHDRMNIVYGLKYDKFFSKLHGYALKFVMCVNYYYRSGGMKFF